MLGEDNHKTVYETHRIRYGVVPVLDFDEVEKTKKGKKKDNTKHVLYKVLSFTICSPWMDYKIYR